MEHEKVTQADVDKDFILMVIDDTNWIYDSYKNDDITPLSGDMSAANNALIMALTHINGLGEENQYFVDTWERELSNRQIMLQHLYRKHCIEKTFKKFDRTCNRIPWEAYKYLLEKWKAYADNPVGYLELTSFIMEDVKKQNFTFFSYKDALDKAMAVE